MIWLVLLGGLVVAAVIAGFAYLIVGWAGAVFVAIATIGTGAVAWYGYVLYGKATDIAHEGSVVAKRLQAVSDLLAEIKVPDRTAQDAADDDSSTAPARSARAAD